jgi:hypothetical protein
MQVQRVLRDRLGPLAMMAMAPEEGEVLGAVAGMARSREETEGMEAKAGMARTVLSRQ